MARHRTIVSIGEALLAEGPERTEPAGLALDYAQAAMRLGHRGVPISRLGQDTYANELLTQITAGKIEHDHLQSDPDLPTGRLIVRSIAGRRSESLDPRAAFDNLQWDFDLVDVAHEADIVVFGMLAQRGGQSSSITMRFLSEAQRALVLCDLTNRADDIFERSLAIRSLQAAQIAVVDSAAWTILRWRDRDAPHHEAAAALLRENRLDAVLWMDPDKPVELYAADASCVGGINVERSLRVLAIISAVDAILRGESVENAVGRAEKVIRYAIENPDTELPEELR